MPPKRGSRGNTRRGTATNRGRGAVTGRVRGSSHSAVVQKNRKGRKRPVRPEIAAALANSLSCSESQHDTTVSGPKVQRMQRDGHMCTRWSLDFAYNFPRQNPEGETVWYALESSENNDIIALNFMDHFMQPENMIPELRYGLLQAASFALACDLTNISKCFATIAEAVQARTAMLLHLDENIPSEAVEVGEQDVEKAYGAMLRRRKDVYPLVGGYASRLASTAHLVLSLDNIDEEYRHCFKRKSEVGKEDPSSQESQQAACREPKADDGTVEEELLAAGLRAAEDEVIDFDVFDDPGP